MDKDTIRDYIETAVVILILFILGAIGAAIFIGAVYGLDMLWFVVLKLIEDWGL